MSSALPGCSVGRKRPPARLKEFAAVCLLIGLAGAGVAQSRTEGREELLLESQLLAGSGATTGLSSGAWRPGGNPMPAPAEGARRAFAGLRFRYAAETQRDEVYLLTKQFTLLSNGVAVATILRSNLVCGDGTTRWETNTITAFEEPGGIAYKLGDDVLARGPGRRTAMGVARIGLERYGGGCGACGPKAEPGRPGPVYGGGLARFGLGQTLRGRPAGELFIPLGAWSPELCQPEALGLLEAPGQVTVVKAGAALRQVGTAQCLADILKLDAHSYRVAFYATNALIAGHDGHTLFSTKGLHPFVQWTIEQPEPAGGAHRLRVTEQTGSLRITNEYRWTEAACEFIAGNGLRKQVLTKTWDAARKTRTETCRTFEGACDTLVAQTTARYRLFDWGEALVEEVLGTGTAAQTNRWQYYDSRGTASEGRLQAVRRANGYWERYEYDEKGRLEAKYSPFGNTAPEDPYQGRVVIHSYAPWSALGDQPERFPLRPRTVTELVRGVVVGKRYFIAGAHSTLEARCSRRSQAPFDSPMLCTTNRYYPPGEPDATRLQSVELPDGTMEICRYAEGPFGLTNSVLRGQPNAAHTDIVDGRKTVTVSGPAGQLLAKEIWDIAPGRTNLLLHREAYAYSDDLQRSHTVTYLDGTSTGVQYACCGIESTTDRDGVVTLYTQDDLKRVLSETRLVNGQDGITKCYQYDAANRLLSTVRIASDGRQRSFQSGSAYDTAGRICFQTNALQAVTTFTYGSDEAGRALVIRREPGGGTRIEARNRDGSLHQVTGTAAHGLRYEYGTAPDGRRFTREIKLNPSGEATGEQTVQYADLLGRECQLEYPGGASSQSFYNRKGQLCKERDPDGVTTLYAYNGRGERDAVALRTDPANPKETVDYAGTDRVTRTLRDVVFNPALGTQVERTRTCVLDEFNSAKPTLLLSVEKSTDGLRLWRTHWNEGLAVTNRTELRYSPGGRREQYEYAADGSCTYREYRFGRLQLLQHRDALGATNAETRYEYDGHGRPWKEHESRNGLTLYEYNAADQVTKVTKPPPDTGQEPPATLTQYNALLQPTNIVFPDCASAATEYHATGEIKRSYGARTYPVEYTCDHAGRVQTLQTLSNTNGSTAAGWTYDPARGWLTGKQYPGCPPAESPTGKPGPDYTYTPGGRLQSRLWERGIRTEYAYNSAGDLSGIAYSDGATPNLAFTYDRRGRLALVSQGGTQVYLTYNGADLLARERWSGSLFEGAVVASDYDQWLRRTGLVWSVGSHLSSVRYAYDAASRLQTVSQLEDSEAGPRLLSATYAYEPNSPLVKEVSFKQGDLLRARCLRQYDHANRLLSVSTAPANSPALRHEYSYDEADQPRRVSLADRSYWLYSYDALGQLRSGKKYSSDDKAIQGQQFEYDFDEAGNRLAARDGNSAGKPPKRNVSSQFRYDQDGNLTNDGRWVYGWDGENRLVSLESQPGAAVHSKCKLLFSYDWRGRRIAKQVFLWNAGAWRRVSESRFLYDGWNLLAELRAPAVPVRSFVWGQDLSGAAQEVGAAGRLLWLKSHGTPQRTCFAGFDGNGNLTALINAGNGKTAALYEYGPFGEMLRSQQPAGSAPFRFSTRYLDEETGLLYCGHRYYNPGTGRWLSRDPLYELAFRRISERLFEEGELVASQTMYAATDYVYVRNAPVGNVDLLGLASSCDLAVRRALASGGNRRLLQKILKAGGPAPRFEGSDAQEYCALPGFLGEYDCASRRGRICCLNLDHPEQVEQTVRHELIHALDCARNGLSTCEDRICSEIVAYYMTDCERFVNRLDCALGQMRHSMEVEPQCALAAAAVTKESAEKCLRSWKAGGRRF